MDAPNLPPDPDPLLDAPEAPRPIKRPWERQPGEGTKAFAAFVIYRDLGRDRSLVKVADELRRRKEERGEKGGGRPGSIPTRLSTMSSQWRWVARSAAWDEEEDRLRLKARVKAVEEMAERQATYGMLMQQVGVLKLQKLREAVQEDDSAVSGPLAVKMVEAGSRVERLARGEPSEIVGQGPDEFVEQMKQRLENADLETLQQFSDALDRLCNAPPGAAAPSAQ